MTPDVVSFPLRLVIDVTPDSEHAKAADARRQKLAWMRERDYRIVELSAGEVTKDVTEVLDRILAIIAHQTPNGGPT